MYYVSWWFGHADNPEPIRTHGEHEVLADAIRALQSVPEGIEDGLPCVRVGKHIRIVEGNPGMFEACAFSLLMTEEETTKGRDDRTPESWVWGRVRMDDPEALAERVLEMQEIVERKLTDATDQP